MKKIKARTSPVLLKRCCSALAEKKAEDLRILDVSGQSSITDYLILATATSEPHLRALRIELAQVLKDTHTHVVGVETGEDSGWLVVDAFEIMVHLFIREKRAHYSLENLWRDAVEIPVGKLLAAPKPRAAKKRSSKRVA